MATDKSLGYVIHEQLESEGIESPMIPGAWDTPLESSREKIADKQFAIMTMLGLNVEDSSLKNTPERVARMYCEEIFSGLDYSNFPNCSTFENPGSDQMVAVRDIEVRSMCEHHFLPFIGSCTIGYIPDNKILGISKFNRIVDFFCRRPQVQERLTSQITSTLKAILGTPDVAVYIEAEHLCSKMRGIKDFTSSTVTSSINGKFRFVPELRAEFMALTHGK